MDPKKMYSDIRSHLDNQSKVVEARTIIRRYHISQGRDIPPSLLLKAVGIIEQYTNKETDRKAKKALKALSSRSGRLEDKIEDLSHMKDDLLFDTEFINNDVVHLPGTSADEEPDPTIGALSLLSIKEEQGHLHREDDRSSSSSQIYQDFMSRVAQRRMENIRRSSKRAVATPEEASCALLVGLPDAPSKHPGSSSSSDDDDDDKGGGGHTKVVLT